MFAEQRPLTEGAGVQRDELFSLAEQLSEELGRMGGQLRAIVAQVGARQTFPQGGVRPACQAVLDQGERPVSCTFGMSCLCRWNAWLLRGPALRTC
jgi:hypothetical protein